MNDLSISNRELYKIHEDLWAAIPADIRELLFFTFEELSEDVDSHIVRITIGLDENNKVKSESENINTYVDPSLIYFSLPIDIPEQIENIPAPYKWTKYYKLSPAQKYKYLRWLCDVDQPIEEGYFNIFLCGLEKRLFDDKRINAVKMLERLSKTQNAKLYYRENTVTQSLFTADLMLGLNFSNLTYVYDCRYWDDFQFYIKHFNKEPLFVEDIVKYLSSKADNTRYIDKVEYKIIFVEILEERTGRTYIDTENFINDNDIRKSSIVIGFRNPTLDIKLRGQSAYLPKISKLLNFLFDIHKECHERTKLKLREMRKKH